MMNARGCFAVLGSIALAALAGGCHSMNTCAESAMPAAENAGAPSQAGTTTAGADGTRAVAEADIIQLDGDRLYAMSKSGTVAIVDVSDPTKLTLLGKATLSGEPFEMYRVGDVLLAMSNGAVASDGTVRPPVPEGQYDPTTAPDHTNDGSVVTTLDVHDPANIRPLAQFVIDGEIADSRMVGSALYVATYENAACFGCGSKPRTLVTSFDASDPTSLKKVDQLSFQSNAPDSYSLAWGMAWKRSILATDQRLYVGGHADFDPTNVPSTQQEGIVDVVDITDPSGKMTAGARVNVAGAVLNRWQMDETAGVFRVISQAGAGRTGNGTAMPSVDTFTIASTTAFTPLGHTTLTLPRQEGLRTVRFDGTRAYAITFNQTDPLFAIDLADPAHPQQKGQLQMPGWMFYLEPHGDRVIGLGVDRTDPNGSLNVSLFDVSDMTAPKMLQRVAFGASGLNEDYQILNYEVPEDQDRIQKAFKVFPDGLVAVPFSASKSGAGGGTCDQLAGGVQLVRWASDTLTKDALLPMKGNPRRAFEKGAQIIAVSDSNVSAFSLGGGGVSVSSSAVTPTADVTIGACVAKTLPQGSGGFGGREPGDWVYGGGYSCE